MVINVYATGEGYLVYLLLKDFLTDIKGDTCLRYTDRPLLSEGDINLFLVPNLSSTERELISNLPRKGEIVVISRNCDGMEGCFQVGETYLSEALALVFERVLNRPGLGEEIRNFSPKRDKKLLNLLAEKLTFYLPIGVAKRGAIIQGWKFYLGLAGVPFAGYVYPFEERPVLNTLSNIGFSDKVFPLILGRTSQSFLSEVKKRGFVPFEVYLEGKNNLLSELSYILLAKELSESIQKL